MQIASRHSCMSYALYVYYPPFHTPSAAYPNKIDKICSSVVMIQCRHFPNCQEIPDSVRDQLAALKRAGNANAVSCSGTKRLEVRHPHRTLQYMNEEH